MVRQISQCRVSGSTNLVPVLDLGVQHLTGTFPASPEEDVTQGPLELVFCPDSGLVQLRHAYDLDELYGMNYGYRSGLNASMVAHLTRKARDLQALARLGAGDAVLDLGSNDATTLKAYTVQGLRRIGVDPTGKKFAPFYTDGVELIPDFFTAEAFRATCGDLRPKLITSISMFYDLEDPARFVRDVAAVLAPDGIWHFEQSYLGSMLKANAYDTVCHEHLEYYALVPVLALLEACGLKALDVELNAVNGGSFAVSACHAGADLPVNRPRLDALLAAEADQGLATLAPYRAFETRVRRHRDDLTALLRDLAGQGRRISGYGASTKGNVLLQYCGLGPADLACVAEVNPDKFGRFTPGTGIPIVSEAVAKAARPDYLLVLPWHFRDAILAREQDYLRGGGKLIFPLPEIEIVGAG